MESQPAGRSKVPAFLSDLGKATRRGIRKCPRCGTYNGTRGLSCKNQACAAVFRFGARRQPGPLAVQVVTGSDPRLFSVRQRQRGPDRRGFVELAEAGRCHVPGCRKPDGPCHHLKLARDCRARAAPLTLKSSVLSAMPVPPEVKQTLWRLASQPPGPLVQRVTKTTLVVKCQSAQRPGLGYVHTSFARKAGAKGAAAAQRRFLCSCQGVGPGRALAAKEDGEDEDQEEEEEEQQPAAPRCIHFFACLCAFASDDALAQEFSDLLRCHSAGLKGVLVPQVGDPPESTTQAGEPPASKPKKRKKDEASANSLLPPQDGGGSGSGSGSSHSRKSGSKKTPVASFLKRQACGQAAAESQVSLSFQEWLASVTERINQTMHYQFDGKPEPLLFHIPQAFFDALQQRIAMGSTKKRVPNATTDFVRKDALPLGTFSKYTWHITSILQVKQILDTPEMPLEITRSFIQNQDGSYELFRCPKVEVESVVDAYGHQERQPTLRPLQMKTFLKVGHTSPDQKEPTPFTIEWTPGILPRSKMGELRIQFEYGHHRNGPPAPRPPPDQALELTPLTAVALP
ncbi:uncharacterized protein C2orf42 homolog isoform X2 [Tachyglossus aculeatus]|uniref:uncharacterized protein C2orf42 homolog isoform X2 n=1 Tax=Tachyglossus aculeatus TaxID=9261 RepID=UPI0018F76F20|nr:uncharacterized protein C2orf42 homolog isoform X2 [Tachyglossus aculeatus]